MFSEITNEVKAETVCQEAALGNNCENPFPQGKSWMFVLTETSIKYSVVRVKTNAQHAGKQKVHTSFCCRG